MCSLSRAFLKGQEIARLTVKHFAQPLNVLKRMALALPALRTET
jgi:hypothetical protein